MFNQGKFLSMNDSFKKAISFLENNFKGILFNNIYSNEIENPISTVIIPVYNSQNYILKTIKSVQNQNIINIEIILVNDHSTDNTLSFIEEIKKEDARIRILNNKKNMGIFYSRNIGALLARGEFIFPLDNDDMLLDDDVVQIISNIAHKGFFDIIEFKGIRYKKQNKNNILDFKIKDILHSNHPLNLELYQPELGNFSIKQGKTLDSIYINEVYLWAKAIRTLIYKKVINKLGIKRYSRHMIRHEDILMNYALFNTAKSYKFIGKYGIFNESRNKSASKIIHKREIIIYYIYILDIAIDFVIDKEDNKKILVNLILFILKQNSLKELIKANSNIKYLFASCINKVLNIRKISNKLKNVIRNRLAKNYYNYIF